MYKNRNINDLNPVPAAHEFRVFEHFKSDKIYTIQVTTLSLQLLILFHTYEFSELANAGRPLFPGNDVDDQLKRIFK